MVLTKYQKELIHSIAKGKITDIYTFLDTVKELTNEHYTGVEKGYECENRYENRLQTIYLKSGDNIYYYDTDNFNKVKSKLIEFIFLCDFLEIQFLIRGTKLSEGANRKCYFLIDNKDKKDIKHINVNNILNQLSFERYRYVFEASPAINEFIKRKYLSDSDYKFRVSNKMD